MILQDPLEHIAAERQIKLPRQHAQAGHWRFNRPRTAEVGEAAVIPEAAIPILERLVLLLHRHDRRGALLPIGLEQLGLSRLGLLPPRLGGHHQGGGHLGRRRGRPFGEQPGRQLAAHPQAQRPQQLFPGGKAIHVVAAQQPGAPLGPKAVFTGGDHQHLLLIRRFAELMAGPVPQHRATGGAGRGAGGRHREQFLEVGLGQGPLQALVTAEQLQERGLGQQPQLTGEGRRHRLASDAAHQADMAHHLTRTNALQGERLLPFIQAQQAQLALRHQGHPRRQGGVIKQFLPRAQLQRLQRFRQRRQTLLGQLGKRLPSPHHPQCQRQLHGREFGGLSTPMVTAESSFGLGFASPRPPVQGSWASSPSPSSSSNRRRSA